MSIAQWTVSNETGASESLSTSSPLEGSSSLYWDSSTMSGNGAMLRGLTSGADITTGKIRSLFKIATFGGAAAKHLGLFGMMQSSIAYGSNAYSAYLNSSATGDPFATTVYLGKGSLGSATVLSGPTALGFTVNAGTLFALELKWQLDSDSGQVVLTVSAGVSSDFSDLSSVIVYTDASTPYSSGVSAGPFWWVADGSGATMTARVDKTQIFRV